MASKRLATASGCAFTAFAGLGISTALNAVLSLLGWPWWVGLAALGVGFAIFVVFAAIEGRKRIAASRDELARFRERVR